MCLIVRQPLGLRLSRELLEAAWERNHDGWGLIWREPGAQGQLSVLHVRRGMRWTGLLEAWQKLPPDCEAFFHLRKATVGPVAARLAHPFPVHQGHLWLMHNGTIEPLQQHAAAQQPAISDSLLLARHMACTLGSLEPAQAMAVIRKPGFKALIEPLCRGSFVLLTDAIGHVTLGRPWHTIGPREWSLDQHGIEVSNTTNWPAGQLCETRERAPTAPRAAGSVIKACS